MDTTTYLLIHSVSLPRQSEAQHLPGIKKANVNSTQDVKLLSSLPFPLLLTQHEGQGYVT